MQNSELSFSELKNNKVQHETTEALKTNCNTNNQKFMSHKEFNSFDENKKKYNFHKRMLISIDLINMILNITIIIMLYFEVN